MLTSPRSAGPNRFLMQDMKFLCESGKFGSFHSSLGLISIMFGIKLATSLLMMAYAWHMTGVNMLQVSARSIARHWMLVGSAIGAIVAVFDGFAIQNNGSPWVIRVLFDPENRANRCGLLGELVVPMGDLTCDTRRACFCNNTGEHLWPRLHRPPIWEPCGPNELGPGAFVCTRL